MAKSMAKAKAKAKAHKKTYANDNKFGQCNINYTPEMKEKKSNLREQNSPN